MNKQKLSGIIMVPVVAIAIFVAYRSYKATLGPDIVPGGVSSATGRSSGGGGGGGGGARTPPTPAQIVDGMDKELTLTADQKTKLLAIQEDLAAQRKALPATMSRDDKRAKNTAAREAADVKIKALLTPDQQKKYAEMQEKRKAQMAERAKQGGPGGGGMGGSGGGMGGPGGGGPMGGGSGGRMGGPGGGGPPGGGSGGRMGSPNAAPAPQ